ncbi:imidazoleglycerol-phosphate dehydratase, partial [bacterium]|nr:imidazoleglycerol-phosphate dehydratase [bacterium]
EARNFRRYGLSFLPMDEALARAVVDLSGRPFLVFNAEFERPLIGTFSTEMVEEFFRALAYNAKMTLHLSVEYGQNTHHKIEALFKAAGQALREALEIDPHRDSVASTKGVL